MIQLTHDDYHGLLSNPPGRYGKVNCGQTWAVTLTGSDEFRARGYNLFSSFGGDSQRGAWVENRPPTIRVADRPDTIWFCLPLARIEAAVRLYLYPQLYRVKGVKRAIVDDEGDLIETVCDNEAELWAEAQALAARFVANEMPSDWDAVPSNDWEPRTVVEHSVGSAPREEWD